MTQQCVVKEDDPDTTMVCMVGTRRGRRSTKIIARNSDPAKGEESENTSESRLTLITDNEAPLVGKNTRGMSSLVLRDIDDDVLPTTRSLKSRFSPHTGLGKYSVFMAGETSAPTIAEEPVKVENSIENMQVLAKLQKDRINQMLLSYNS